MSSLAVVLSQTKYSLISLSRNKRSIIFTVIFPIFLLVLFAGIFGGSSEVTSVQGQAIAYDAYFTAGMIAYALTGACFTTLAISLTTQRESGFLKRLRGTPIPSWTFVVSQIIRSLVLVVAMTVVLGVVAHFAYDVDFGAGTVGALLVYLVLGTFTMCTLGIALTALTTSAESATAIAPFGIVILSFISGVFITVASLPSWLVDIGRVFPLAHLAEGLQRSLVPGAGSAFDWVNLAILAGWGVAGLVVAARLFRWEPQASKG